MTQQICAVLVFWAALTAVNHYFLQGFILTEVSWWDSFLYSPRAVPGVLHPRLSLERHRSLGTAEGAMSAPPWARKGMEFGDIPQFVPWGQYAVNIDLNRVPVHIGHYIVDYNLDVDPPFQRAHVWTVEQKSRYIEFILRGGRTARTIFFNCFNWNSFETPRMVLVDGKQRLDAVCEFFANQVEVFGGMRHRDFTGRTRVNQDLTFHVNDLPSWSDVYQWYLDLNAGGTVHTEKDLNKVRTMLADTSKLPPQHWELAREDLMSPLRVHPLVRVAAQEAIEERTRALAARAKAEAEELARTASKKKKRSRSKR